MKIEYQEASIDEIIEYYAAGFVSATVMRVEWFIDPLKGVVFKMHMLEESDVSK